MYSLPYKYGVRFGLGFLIMIGMQDMQPCTAQVTKFNYEHLTTEHGLSSDKVEGIVQDESGFYWIATQNGLNRYDGTSFRVYQHHHTDSLSLTHNSCTVLAEGNNGDIWIGTYRGVSRYLRNEGRFQRIYLHHPSKNFEIVNRVFCLDIDKEGNVWIAGNGLWKYSPEKDTLEYMLAERKGVESISQQSLITHMSYDSIRHGMWFSNAQELVFFDIDENAFFTSDFNPHRWEVFEKADGAELTLDRKHQLWFLDRNTQRLCYFNVGQNTVTIPGDQVITGLRRIYADNKNRIWLCYWNKGTEIFDPQTASIDTLFLRINDKPSMPADKTVSLFIDHQENYWISSGDGIRIYNDRNQYYIMHELNTPSSGVGREHEIITAIAQSEPEHIWIGTNFGLYKYHLASGTCRLIQTNIPGTGISALCIDNHFLWEAVYDELWCMDMTREVVVKKISMRPRMTFILKDIEDHLWVGLWTDGLYRIDLKNDEMVHFSDRPEGSSALKSNTLVSGLMGPDRIWIGYNGGVGFSSLELSGHQSEHFDPAQKDSTDLFAGTITVISTHEFKELWFGTYGGGVFQFDPATGAQRIYQQDQGLNSNFINSIVIDDERNLWISTADGLNYFNAAQSTISQVDVDLIFPDNDFLANGIRGVDNRLYFSCKNKFVEIYPALYPPEQPAPRIVISSFKIFDQEVPLTDEHATIHLAHQQNFFSFEYSLLRTHPHKKVKYAFILEGFEEIWNEGTKNFASYTNVPAGHYRFNVKATNADGQWSDVLLSIPLYVRPPFWLTWWFIALCAAVVATAVFAVYSYRIGQIRKIYTLKSKISRDLHDDVGSALSSIHIYSTVAEKALDNNPLQAHAAVTQIKQNSKQVMENMSDIVWAINTGNSRESTFEQKLKNYGYELLTPLGISCKYDIEPAAEKQLVQIEVRKNVLLIAKEAMNNIAKYSGATEATFQFYLSGSFLQLQISDNGSGFNPNITRKGNGLFNMQQRTETLGGKFTLETAEPGGTTIRCRFPLSSISFQYH